MEKEVFRCPFCNKIFTNRNDAIIHIIEEAENTELIQKLKQGKALEAIALKLSMLSNRVLDVKEDLAFVKEALEKILVKLA